MRSILMIGVAVHLTGCTAATMEGFNQIASQADVERVDISSVPAWMSGKFLLGGDEGRVRRTAMSDAIGWGPDDIGSDFDLVTDGNAARFGRMTFEISRPELGGRAEARCAYFRGEERVSIDRITLARPSESLSLSCRYRIEGRDAGTLSLIAEADNRVRYGDGRTGEITILGTSLGLQTRHGLAEASVAIAEPSGYVMIDSDGQTVGALELTGGATRRAVLPNDAAQRKAAVLAAITLALFWDPGDVG